VGIQGLAPYWFEVEATAYLSASGHTHFRFETEYELLLTNRLVLQPLVEAEIYGKADPERGIGAGLSSVDAGLRLRYEIRRELAPYVGVTWHRKFFGTADLAETAGEETGGARLTLGARIWF
jgi:copper resistance protein B